MRVVWRVVPNLLYSTPLLTTGTSAASSGLTSPPPSPLTTSSLGRRYALSRRHGPLHAVCKLCASCTHGMCKLCASCTHRKVPSRSPFGNVPSVRSARARLARSARATAPRAAVRGGRPRSLRVRPRAADWRMQERDFAKPHLRPVLHFTYIKTQLCSRQLSCRTWVRRPCRPC